MEGPASGTRSAEAGAALRQRLAASAPTMSDGEGLSKVLQGHFWLGFALQEAKGTLQRLRALLCGQAPKAPKAPAPASSHAERAGPSDALLCPPEASEAQEAGCEAASGEAEAEAAPTPAGGQRLGTGRLGAHADAGAERVDCRHDELAAGQRCPVCGQGTLEAFPPKSAMRLDGPALRSALRSPWPRRRGSACGEVCTAPLAEEAGHEQYSARAGRVRGESL